MVGALQFLWQNDSVWVTIVITWRDTSVLFPRPGPSGSFLLGLGLVITQSKNVHFVVSVEGGHRAIIFSRIGGIQPDIYTEGLHFRWEQVLQHVFQTLTSLSTDFRRWKCRITSWGTEAVQSTSQNHWNPVCASCTRFPPPSKLRLTISVGESSINTILAPPPYIWLAGFLFPKQFHSTDSRSGQSQCSSVWYPEYVLCRVPWFQWPIIYDIRSRPREIRSLTGSKGKVRVQKRKKKLSHFWPHLSVFEHRTVPEFDKFSASENASQLTSCFVLWSSSKQQVTATCLAIPIECCWISLFRFADCEHLTSCSVSTGAVKASHHVQTTWHWLWSQSSAINL